MATLTWLGHGSFRLDTDGGKRIYIDPFPDGPTFPEDEKSPERADAVYLTHGHGDHIGDAAPVARKHGATVVAIFELAAYIGRKGVESTIGMNLGGTVQLGDVAATMVEAKHSSTAQDEEGTHDVGVAAGFVLAVADGPVLYCAGDTTVFGDMKLIGELYHPEVALLP